MSVCILQGDARHLPLRDESVACVVTSPPYWGLRDYGVHGQIGLESALEEYVAQLVLVFREVWRVLHPRGVVFLNLGDTYSSAWPCARRNIMGNGSLPNGKREARPPRMPEGLKEKDLCGVPWRVAFALQAEGWYLRSDIIWCLSGGAWLYAKTQKGEMPIMVRDLTRLDPATVSLWNGEKWTRALGWNKSLRQGDEIELVLRSGERISCTPSHKWPTARGLLPASELRCGDLLQQSRLPEPEQPRTASAITQDVAWFLGLYLAEGSRSNDKLQISGHANEIDRLQRLRPIVAAFGGSLTFTLAGNELNIRIYSRVLTAIVDDHISGYVARDKGIKVRCWSYDNKWLRALLDGYLEGDGHWDADNQRWRLGFTRNYNLERDLRVLAARLGAALTLTLSTATNQEGEFPCFRGELRFHRSGHHNEKSRTEIVEIRKARCREVYDIGVEDEPHLFALASGVLTHNSKPNPMPESVTDRPTKAHEYVFLLTKNDRYYYDAEAVKEPSIYAGERITLGAKSFSKGQATGKGIVPHGNGLCETVTVTAMRNLRSVWTMPTENFSGAHFATMPTALVKRCILAGCPPGGITLDPFSGAGTTVLVADRLGRHGIGIELNRQYCDMSLARARNEAPLFVDLPQDPLPPPQPALFGDLP